MKIISLLLLNFIINPISFAQDPTSYKINKQENKYVFSENSIKIFDGQRIFISTKNQTGRLEGLKLVDTAESKIKDYSKLMTYVLRQNGEKNICIDVNIVIDDNKKSQTVLIVNNPYKGTMSYKAKIFSKKENDYIETSIANVEPGISGIELWPYPITDFILYDFIIKE